MPELGAERVGRARAPHPKAKLLPRPMGVNPTVVDAGEGFRNVQVVLTAVLALQVRTMQHVPRTNDREGERTGDKPERSNSQYPY